MIKRVLALAAVAAGICLGSAGAASAAPAFDLNKLITATHNDLAAAKADADAHGDKIASQCYAGVDAYITANPVNIPTINVVGVASGFQTARDVVKATQNASVNAGIPDELVLACGPLALDVQNDLGKAAAQFTLLGIKLPF